MDKDEPEEGEIQDDDGLLEDVSSDEDTLPIYCSKTSETCDKYPIRGTVETDFVTRFSRVHKRRVRNACKRKSESFSSSAEGSKPRLNVKYREETNKTSNDYHVTLNPVVVDEHRRDDNFVNMTSEYKSIRPKQSDKDEDIVQEKENRHDCQKEAKVKRKCRRKRRHSGSKLDSDVANQQVGPGQDGKKEDTFAKFGTKCKSSHSKKRHVSPKREKRRYSKKKEGRKCWSRRLSGAVQNGSCTGNGVEGNSLLKRLQPMMTGNVAARKEKTAVETVKGKDEEHVESQKLEHGLKDNLLPPADAVKSDNEKNRGISEAVDSLKQAENNIFSQSSEDVVVLYDIKRPEPIVITIEDSDGEPQVSVDELEHNSGGKVNKEGEVKVIEGEASTTGTDEDEDLAQLRLLALQSNRRKVTSKPGAEDDEVMQLRLAALKSAVLKKCEVRKQRGVTLNSNKINTLNSPPLRDLESSGAREELGQETQKPEVSSVEALQSEPDETTTLVDMELSHTDDESSAQNEIITDPVSADTPLPGDSAGMFLPLMHEDYTIQKVPCSNEPLLAVHEYKPGNFKQNQKEQDAVSTWNTASTVYRSPELARYDLEGCQMSGAYGNNVQIPHVGYSNSELSFTPLSFPQQQLHNELYQSNSSSDLGSGDQGGVCSDPVISPFDSSVSPAVSRSFVSSDLNCQTDTVLASRVEPQVVSASSSIPRIESHCLKTEFIASKIGVHISRASSVAATEDPHLVTLRTETETQKTGSSVCTQFCIVDSTTVSCQNWDGNVKSDLSSRNNVPFENLSLAASVKTVGIGGGHSTILSTPAESFSPCLNCQNQELRSEAGTLSQSHSIFVPAGEIVEHKSDCNVEENSSELENIDLSNMIVLDEVGRCSSPEAKVEEVSNEQVTSKNEGTSQHHDQSSISMDEDEEILRAKVLTTLVRKPSTSTAYLVNEPSGTKDNQIPGPSEVSSMQHTKTSTTLRSVLCDPTLPSCNLEPVQRTPVSHGKEGRPSKLTGPFDKLKGSGEITLTLPNNKLEHSQQNLSNYNEGNVVTEKCWKKSVKMGFSGINTKQNSCHIKQLQEPAAAVINDAQSTASELKTSAVHCKPVGNPIPRVVFRPRAPRPATLQVTVPADSVHDEEHRRKIAGSLVGSSASVVPSSPQRFVIHLGEDSDSPDEDSRTQQQPPQAPKRRCIITKNFSVPLQTRLLSCDSFVNCSSNVSSSLLPQLHSPVSDKQNAGSVSTQPTPNSRMTADFEKSVDIFLKQARKSQEATAKKAVTPNRCVGGKTNPVASSVTPLAVRHLPSSRQEEYHRLKKQIAELEEQRKRSRQQHLSKNMSSTKSASLPSSPGHSASASSSVKPPLKIVLSTTSADKREIMQSSVTSANLGNDASAKKVMQWHPTGHVQGLKDVKASDGQAGSAVARGVAQAALSKGSSHSFLAGAVLPEATQSDTGTSHTAASLNPVPKKHQKRAIKETKNLASAIRKEEEPLIESQESSAVKDGLLNVCDVHKQSSCQCDCLSSEEINFEETLEQKEAKLAEIEHQLLSKRYEVVDDLTSMAALLHQIERERTAEEECLSELHRTQQALQRIEERLVQQKVLLLNMRNDISESHRRVAQGRAECISLSKNCLSLGISVKGRIYKVPAGGAELMNLKLQQVAVQTRRLSRKKEYLEDGDGSPSGSDVTAFTCLQIPGQDKVEVRTARFVVEGSKDTSVSYNVCASPTTALNAESETIPMPRAEHSDALVPKTDISQSECTSSSEMLEVNSVQQVSISSTPLSLSTENVTASKLDKCVPVSNDSETETKKDQDSVLAVTDIKQASMAVSEDLEMMVLGVDCSSKETVVEHVAEYRSPLEHFHSKRGDSKAGDGLCGPLDPLAILCPYELMGSCQDEECSYQHHTKTTTT